MDNETRVKQDLDLIWHPCSQMKDYQELKPIIIQKGQGMYLYDLTGKEYMDVVSSWWCNLLGHSHPKINQALKTQVDKLEHVIFANFSHEPAIELCSKLKQVVPKGLSKFFFTDNGSSAIEAAMKMSFQYHYQMGKGEKKKFMALTDAYHGETLGALSVGGVDLYSKMFSPILLDVIRIEGPDQYRRNWEEGNNKAADLQHLEEMFAEHGAETTAFLIEPMVQAAAGMKIYHPDYLRKLRELCDHYDVHLIADEIAVGFGRTGKMFACNHPNISPDIMCVSKGLTGGYLPMAIAITTDKIYQAFYDDYNKHKAFLHSHTYCGNPLACSVALEVLTILEEEQIIAHANANSAYFTDIITEQFGKEKYVGDIRSIGLINAIEIVEDKAKKQSFDAKKRLGYQIYKKALAKGLLLRPLGDILYFNPPLIMKKAEMDKAVRIAKSAYDEIMQ